METINVQCGHCGKLMAVSTEHLGARVSCPHCQGVVEAPASAPPGSRGESPTPPEIKVPVVEATESIFAAEEPESTEDIFGSQDRPLIEMPHAPEPSGVTLATTPDVPRALEKAPAPLSPPLPELFLDKPAASAASAEKAPWTDDEHTEPAPAEQAEAPAQAVGELEPRRYVAKRSLLGPMLLMFLIPYCLVTTGFVIWLLYTRSKAPEPFEFLRDPAPTKDGPDKGKGRERVKYDARLPAKLHTALGQTLQVGDIEVTPLKVALTDGDLAIQLKLRNLASSTTFNPLPDAFANLKTFEPNYPYTFLEVAPGEYVFGGSVTYRRQNKNFFQDGKLAPGDEMLALLTTNLSARREIARIVATERSLLWRIQVRRGLVDVDGARVSATTVIGVEFATSTIEKGAS